MLLRRAQPLTCAFAFTAPQRHVFPNALTRVVTAASRRAGTMAAEEGPVARRIVLFGMAQVPLPVLQLLAALARHCQVLLAIPNPCRFQLSSIQTRLPSSTLVWHWFAFKCLQVMPVSVTDSRCIILFSLSLSLFFIVYS